eukprot:SAG31_NODE_2577_length_5451_cov_3.176757_1_plen_162_part_00
MSETYVCVLHQVISASDHLATQVGTFAPPWIWCFAHVQVKLSTASGGASVKLQVFDAGYGAAQTELAIATVAAMPSSAATDDEWQRVDISAAISAAVVPHLVRVTVTDAVTSGGLLAAAAPHAELVPSQNLQNVVRAVLPVDNRGTPVSICSTVAACKIDV